MAAILKIVFGHKIARFQWNFARGSSFS